MIKPLQEINAYIENKDNYTFQEQWIILEEIEKSLYKKKFDYIPIQILFLIFLVSLIIFSSNRFNLVNIFCDLIDCFASSISNIS